jgi:hypothetical protein
LRACLLGPGFSHGMGSSGRQLLLVSERRAWRECGRTACGWSRRRAERRVRSRVRQVEKKSRAENGASSCSPRRWDGTWKGDETRAAFRSGSSWGGDFLMGLEEGTALDRETRGRLLALSQIHHPMARRPPKTWPPLGENRCPPLGRGIRDTCLAATLAVWWVAASPAYAHLASTVAANYTAPVPRSTQRLHTVMTSA